MSLVSVCVMSVYTNASTGRGVVSCDWFALSCKLAHVWDGKPLVAPHGWQCLQMSSTAVWSQRWFVLDADGNKVATLLFQPRTPKIPQESANVQIANRWLYYDDFRAVCDSVLDIIPMAVCGLNRVDLCCDFEMTPELWTTYMALAKKDARLKGLHDSVAWWKDIPIGVKGDGQGLEEIPNQVNWGGKDSTFKWKVYYKWLELETAPPDEKKPWIQDLWERMGFNARSVWRVEVSINGPNQLRRLGGERILPFEWYDNRVRLFSDIYADKFVIRRKQGHADRRNDEIMPFLEVDGAKSVKYGLPSSSREGSDPEKRLVCKLWAELQQGDVQCNSLLTDLLKNNICELLQRPSNVWVLQRMFNVTMDDIAKAIDMPFEGSTVSPAERDHSNEHIRL